MIEFDQIARITRQRIDERNPILRMMNEVKRRYNGDWVIPLPDLDKEPVLPPVTPFLVAQAVDNLGMRAGSVMPFWTFPETGVQETHRTRARNRKRAWSAICYKSYFHFVQRRAFNHLAGYAFCNIRVIPDFDLGLPRMLAEDPLSSFPEPRRPEDPTPPSNCAYVYEMPAMQIRGMYPACRSENGGPVSPDPRGFSEMWTMVDWIDDDWCVIGLVGPKFPQEHYKSYDSRIAQVPYLEIARASNMAGKCTVVSPGKIGLDTVASQVANAIGLADFQARLMGLAVTAQEKAAWPDMYVLGSAQGPPRIVTGAWKDGRDGEVNVIENASSVGVLRNTPDPALMQMINQLERNFKTSTNQNAAMVGETNLAMRSARGIDTSMSTSVDPLVYDMHKIVEAYVPHLVDFAFSTLEGIESWGRKKFTVFSGWPTDKGLVEFIPARDLAESHDMVAEYAIAGADVQATTIELGQLRATKAISQQYYRERHPHIGDSESQERQVGLEDLEQAQFTGVLQLIASNQMDPAVAKILYESMKIPTINIFEAMDHAHKEAQRIQAQQPPAPPPGANMDPSMMPGASAPAAPGMGPAANPAMAQSLAPGATELGPTSDQMKQKQLLLALKANPNMAQIQG